MSKWNGKERRSTIEVSHETVANINRMVIEMHKCLFGNGDYKNNLVTDVQNNTRFRKITSKALWGVYAALIGLGFFLLRGAI